MKRELIHKLFPTRGNTLADIFKPIFMILFAPGTSLNGSPHELGQPFRTRKDIGASLSSRMVAVAL